MQAVRDRIKNHEFFAGMKPEHIALVAQGAGEVAFQKGEMIFRTDEPASRFFLIESGSIALEAHEPGDGTCSVQTLKTGDVLGWSWLFPPFVWHFQARALEPVRAIMLDGAHMLVTAERDRDFGYELMKRVTHVLIQRLQTTRKQLILRERKSGAPN